MCPMTIVSVLARFWKNYARSSVKVSFEKLRLEVHAPLRSFAAYVINISIFCTESQIAISLKHIFDT